MSETQKYPVMTIGAGPAGIAAAIQLKRYGIEQILFEKDQVGGVLQNANLVENYPGFPEGISGLELVNLMKFQLVKYDIQVTKKKVERLDFTNGYFKIENEENLIQSEYIIISSGTMPIEFQDAKIPDNLKPNVFYEIREIMNCRNMKIVIVGAGDAAFDYALNLGRRNYVTILNRSTKISALPLLQERVSGSERIEYIENIRVKKFKSKLNNKIEIHCREKNSNRHFITDYVVIAIGRKPQLEFITPELMSRSKKLVADGKLYFIGDVANGICRQCSIAVGDGVKAAMSIYENMRDKANADN